MRKLPKSAAVHLAITLPLLLLYAVGTRAELAFTTLASFSGTNGAFFGAVPESRLLLGVDGDLYGTTILGGTNDLGTVFKVSTNGTFSSLYSFSTSSGAYPQAGLEQGSDGNFYGTTTQGGANSGGTAFRITSLGSFTVLIPFDWVNGATPSGIIRARDGNFYGTAWQGGTNGYGQYGIVFKLTTNGNLSALYSFGAITNAAGNALDGQSPQAALVQGSDDALYGTTTSGGTNGGFGTIFRITTNGSFTSLASFNGTNGADPIGALIEGDDGSFLGTASAGGTGFNGSPFTGNGTVFRVTKAGQLAALHYFAGYPDEGAQPNFVGLVDGTDGACYGTTSGGGTNGSGTVFRMTSEGSLAVIYSFTRSGLGGTNTDGNQPMAGLTQGPDGRFYGVAAFGGANAKGTVFSLSNSAFAQPLIRMIEHANGITTVAWKALVGRRYELQVKADVGQLTWTNTGNVVFATNSAATATDAAGSAASRVYRLTLLP